MASEYVCDHATDPKCPWRGCPHRKPHALRHDSKCDRCPVDETVPCVGTSGDWWQTVFKSVRCVPVEGEADAEEA